MNKNMTIRQKRAIYYSYRDKRNASMDDLLNDNGLMDRFLESRFKTKTWFIKDMIKSLEPDRKYIAVNNLYIKAWNALKGDYKSIMQ